VTQGDGSVKYVEQNLLSTDMSLSLTQNISFTGGTLSLESSLERLELFSSKSTSWQTAPVFLTYQQQLFGYNSLKWNKRLEPAKYIEAQRSYVETVELVKQATVSRFFSLAMAQSNLESARKNFAQADTLYRIAQGRYELGTITESDMLQLEVKRLNEETDLLNAGTQLDYAMQSLKSYLGITSEDSIVIKTDSIVPIFAVSAAKALAIALERAPDVVAWQRRLTQADADVAYAKSQAGLKADIYLRFGLTQTARRFEEAYRRPLDQQYVSIGLSLPILDWGRGKGRVKMAKSQRDLVTTQVEQAESDFEQNIRRIVAQFNMAARRVGICRKAAETAERHYDVARRLYVMGKNTVLELNSALSEKDNARTAAVAALEEYWSLYFTLRSLTLYDFERNQEISGEEEL
jgi:outer membrane protein TolC